MEKPAPIWSRLSEGGLSIDRQETGNRMNPPRKLLYFPFWAAAVLGIIGCVTTFVPGAEACWFLVVAILALAGLFIPKVCYRVAAVVLLALSLLAIFHGYGRGTEYRQWRSTHRSHAP
jgi:hydrogenase/urease accessory protein HupE